MRVFIILVAGLLVACNGDNNAKPRFATSSIKGIAAMGDLISGTVTAYDFSQCKQGAVLGKAELTEGANLYNFVLDPNGLELPILLELSKFKYYEEASDLEIDATGNVLYSSFLLRAGVNQNATVSYWTHLAHARTVYKCKSTPANAVQLVTESNELFRKALTFDPINVLPEVILDDVLITSDRDAMKYGVANAAVSYYTVGLDKLSGGIAPHVLFNSISFAEIAYADLTHDGFLTGTDQNGQIYLGDITASNQVDKITVSSHTYRTDIPKKSTMCLPSRRFVRWNRIVTSRSSPMHLMKALWISSPEFLQVLRVILRHRYIKAISWQIVSHRDLLKRWNLFSRNRSRYIPWV